MNSNPFASKRSVLAAVVGVTSLAGCMQSPSGDGPADKPLLEAPPPRIIQEVDLSPVAWPDEVLAASLERHARLGNSGTPARGEKGAIAGTTGAPAVQAGLEALKQGGNAIDALVATSLAQIALAAGGWVSYAGILELMYYDAESGRVFNLNAGYNSVLAETDPASIPAETDEEGTPTPSGRTALVPGYFAGIEAAHENFGALAWEELFAPAIYFAEQGFELHSVHAAMIERRRDVLSRLPETRRIFTRADGEFYGEGDLFRQPALADTLKIVARLGADYIYRGPWAERLVAAVRADGGKMTLEDLARYEVIWQDPVVLPFGDFTLYLHGRPGQGGTHLAESLNLVNASGLLQMGDYRNDPDSFYWYSQIPHTFSISFIPESLQGMVFPGLDVSMDARLTEEYATALWEKIQAGEFVFARPPQQADPKHSDAIVVIDQWGNMAAATHTINTSAWGGTGIFVDGISIPDSAAFQQTALSAVHPGERLPDPTEPVIVFRGGEPFAALSSIGAGLHQKTFTVLLNLAGYGASLGESMAAPSTHLPDFDSSNFLKPPVTTVVAGQFSPELLASTRAMGLEVREFGSSVEERAPRGYVVGAMLDSEGIREAIATELLNAPALAY